MRIAHLAVPALAAAQNVTVEVIQTRTTRFTGLQSSLGNVTLYEPVATVVAATATPGLLIYNNVTSQPSQTRTAPAPAPTQGLTLPGPTATVATRTATSIQPTATVSGAQSSKKLVADAFAGLAMGIGVAIGLLE